MCCGIDNVVNVRLAGLVLAAGRGSRLRPLSDRLPKALCPVGGRPLVDWAIENLRLPVTQIAVNAHHLADQVERHFAGAGVYVSREDRLLGSAGAVGKLKRWIDGRALVVHNADAWIRGDLDPFYQDWRGDRPRLLVNDVGRAADFGSYRFLGLSLLPARMAQSLKPKVSGLYEEIWRPAYENGEIEFSEFGGIAFDCGTPETYALANEIAAKEASWPYKDDPKGG